MPFPSSDYLRALADDMDEEGGIGVIIVTTEQTETGHAASVYANMDRADVDSVLTEVLTSGQTVQ